MHISGLLSLSLLLRIIDCHYYIEAERSTSNGFHVSLARSCRAMRRLSAQEQQLRHANAPHYVPDPSRRRFPTVSMVDVYVTV
ncbi:hypothetical protein BC834DRAFT_907565 [Gloeopeniophorella convolvens]|nr:hypothetical protein BC834DRAFT_907565 [Gloeopeniophorella convolvens]